MYSSTSVSSASQALSKETFTERLGTYSMRGSGLTGGVGFVPASGVAVFLTGIGLDLIGLVGNAEETGPVAAQSAGTLLGLRLMMTVLPMAVLAAALVLFRRRFTLTDDRAAEISAALHREETQNG